MAKSKFSTVSGYLLLLGGLVALLPCTQPSKFSTMCSRATPDHVNLAYLLPTRYSSTAVGSIHRYSSTDVMIQILIYDCFVRSVLIISVSEYLYSLGLDLDRNSDGGLYPSTVTTKFRP